MAARTDSPSKATPPPVQAHTWSHDPGVKFVVITSGPNEGGQHETFRYENEAKSLISLNFSDSQERDAFHEIPARMLGLLAHHDAETEARFSRLMARARLAVTPESTAPIPKSRDEDISTSGDEDASTSDDDSIWEAAIATWKDAGDKASRLEKRLEKLEATFAALGEKNGVR